MHPDPPRLLLDLTEDSPFLRSIPYTFDKNGSIDHRPIPGGEYWSAVDTEQSRGCNGSSA